MRITSLIENTSKTGLPVEHGLSLFIESKDGKKILFDMGQRRLFVDNAERLGIDLRDVDIAVISHGHYDHGGGLAAFLDINNSASVYVHHQAFMPHYSMSDGRMRFIGIDDSLQSNERIKLCQNLVRLNDSLVLFAGVDGNCCIPKGNRLLLGPDKGNDDFCHEQSLIVEEDGKTVLFAGCAHCGIINIMQRASDIIGHVPTHVFAGMHLVKSGMTEEEENAFVYDLSKCLMEYEECSYYTMHCTGSEQYGQLKGYMRSQIGYLSCGDSIEI